MSYTDILIFFSSIFFLQRGWVQGIFRTVLGPATFIVGTLLGYLYYFFTKNAFVSLMIAIFAPILLGTLASSILFFLTRIKGSENNPSTPSRAIASCLNLVWGLIWIICILVMVMMIPDNMIAMPKIRGDIQRSAVYQAASPALAKFLFKDKKNQPLSLSLISLEDPKTIEKLQSSPEYQAFTQDPAMQELLNDPEIAKLAEEKNFAKLMSNPKILKLTSDPELLKKFMALYPKLLKQQ